MLRLQRCFVYNPFLDYGRTTTLLANVLFISIDRSVLYLLDSLADTTYDDLASVICSLGSIFK